LAFSISLKGTVAFAQLKDPRSNASKNKQPAPTKVNPKTITSPSGVATIKITSDADCKFYVDGEYKATITGDNIIKLNLKSGQYQFKAVSISNTNDVFKEYYTVEKAGTEQFYEIPLSQIINRRLRNEQEAAKMEEDRRLQVEQEAARIAAEKERKNQLLRKFSENMVLIAGGSYTMGCTGEGCSDDEKPAHRVTVNSFKLSKYEVTQAQWFAVMGNQPSYFSGCDECPVEQVSWEEVQLFIEKLNELTGLRFRLPSEAEWEYASRGGNQSGGYAYSGSNELDKVGWYEGNSGGKTHEVGRKQSNELGLYDMSGNVWEWCQDWYEAGYYARSPGNNPPGPSSGDGRVVRGGSWGFNSKDCRVSIRSWGQADLRIINYGFRLAQD
jgi:formylglycine-generating enzyme required for sulfatase activity